MRQFGPSAAVDLEFRIKECEIVEYTFLGRLHKVSVSQQKPAVGIVGAYEPMHLTGLYQESVVLCKAQLIEIDDAVPLTAFDQPEYIVVITMGISHRAVSSVRRTYTVEMQSEIRHLRSPVQRKS